MDEKKLAGTPAKTEQAVKVFKDRIKETDKAEVVRGEALSDEALDTVAGGWTHGVEGGDSESDRGFLHPGAVKAGIAVTTYLTCRQCGGPIIPDPRYPHDCSAKKIRIR